MGRGGQAQVLFVVGFHIKIEFAVPALYRFLFIHHVYANTGHHFPARPRLRPVCV